MINAYDIAKQLSANYQGNAKIEFHGVSIDSRAVKQGQCFVAINGEHVDGHDYLQAAKDKGAVCALVEKIQAVDIAQIEVADSTKALGQMAKIYRQTLVAPIVGITGSNGKTTMKEMVACLLHDNENYTDGSDVYKTQGNYNNHLGVPISLLAIKAEAKFAVIEMGMSALGEIDYLTTIAKPQVAIITNAMAAHLQDLKTVDNVVIAKGEIFNGLDNNGVAIINANSKGYDVWLEAVKDKKVVTYKLLANKEMALQCVKDIALDKTNNTVCGYVVNSVQVSNQKNGQEVVVLIAGKSFNCFLPVIGQHNAENLLGAIAVAHSLGLDIETIINRVESIALIKGRSRVIPGLKGSTVIDDSYNANPGSVSAACHTLAGMPQSNKILVLGNMAELGEEAAKYHQEIGDLAKSLGINHLMALGNLTPFTCKAFGENASHFETHAELISELKTQLNNKTVVLVKGSLSMGMAEIVSAIEEEIQGRSA